MTTSVPSDTHDVRGAPDDVERLLGQALGRRAAAVPAVHGSLGDVRRRARRRAARRSGARIGATALAGATVLGAGWLATARGDGGPSVAVPADGDGGGSGDAGQDAPGGGPVAVTAPQAAPQPTVVEGGPTPGNPWQWQLDAGFLWEAVAAQLGTTVEVLQQANPTIDFSQPPAPGQQVTYWGAVPVQGTAPPATVLLPGTVPPDAAPQVSVDTSLAGTVPDVAPQVVVDTSIAGTAPDVAPGVVVDTSIAGTVGPQAPPTTFDGADPPVVVVDTTIAGRTKVVVPGDSLQSIADKTGTTAAAIAEANGWPDGVHHVLYPGDVIAIP